MKTLLMLSLIVTLGWVSQQQDLFVASVSAVIFALCFWFLGGIILTINYSWKKWEDNV
jgi:hypothetical protein